MLQNKPNIKKIIIRLAVLLFWFGVWQGAFMIINKEILIASPLQVFERIFLLVRTAPFWKSVFLSFLRISCGYLLGVLGGVVMAFLTSTSLILKELFEPIIRTARSVPVASFIILALVWIKKTYVPVFIVFLIVMPVIWQNVAEAVRNTDKYLLETAKVYKFGFFKKLRAVYFHSALTSFAAGAVTSLGLAWKSGVAAEVIAMPVSSVGYNLYRAKINIETADLFAWTLVVVILSVALEKLISKILLKRGNGKNDKH